MSRLSDATRKFFMGEVPRAQAAPQGDVIEVLECNWNAVQTYLECQWTLHLGFSGVYYQGISGVEANAAMFALRIPRAKWADTRRRLRQMVIVAKPLLNAKS